jgi:hypothetical protein
MFATAGVNSGSSRGAWAQTSEGHIIMSDFVTTLVAGIVATALAGAIASTPALAADAPDKAAVKQATAACKAQVKEKGKYEEMSWYARHKAVKSCIKDALAKH